MATEKQIAANRRNAQKSTGPKTEEGKARSRENALKHGMTGEGVVQPKAVKQTIRKRLHELREQLQPVGAMEEILVNRVAVASVRLERSVQKELADLARRQRLALRRWEDRQRKAVVAAVRRIGLDPAAAVEALEDRSAGCAWMVEQWSALGTMLDEAGGWDDDQARRALRLLGLRPDDEDDPVIENLWLQIRHAQGEGPGPEHARRARQALAELVDDECQRLEARGEALRLEQEEPERQEVEDRNLIDTSDEGMKRQRYETANEMTLHRNLSQLVRLRKMEPDYASLKRWDVQGKKVGRVWYGTQYIPWPPPEPDDQPEPAIEPQAEPEADRAEPTAAPAPTPAHEAGPEPSARAQNKANFSNANPFSTTHSTPATDPSPTAPTTPPGGPIGPVWTPGLDGRPIPPFLAGSGGLEPIPRA